MLAAVILIGIVIVGFVAIALPGYYRFISVSGSANSQISSEIQAAGIQTSLVYANDYTDSNGNLYIDVYIYNYGTAPFTPTQFTVYIPSTGTTYTASLVGMTYNGNPVSSIAPGQTEEIELVIYSFNGVVPSVYSVTAIGNGIAITWNA